MLGMAGGAVFVFLRGDRGARRPRPRCWRGRRWRWRSRSRSSHLPARSSSRSRHSPRPGCRSSCPWPSSSSCWRSLLPLRRRGHRGADAHCTRPSAGCTPGIWRARRSAASGDPAARRAPTSRRRCSSPRRPPRWRLVFCSVAGRRRRGRWSGASAAGHRGTGTRRHDAFPVLYPKNQGLWLTADNAAMTAWTTHAYVVARAARRGPGVFLGPRARREGFTATLQWLTLDGEAATPVTSGTARPESLAWVPHDVTSLPYQVRKATSRSSASAAVATSCRHLGPQPSSPASRSIARWSSCSKHRARDFAGIADRPEVTLVNDEARAHLARTRTAVRHHPDVADRHVGRHRRRRVHAVGKRALHARGLAHPARPRSRRVASSVSRAGSARRVRPRPAGWSRWRWPRCSTAAWPRLRSTWCWLPAATSRRCWSRPRRSTCGIARPSSGRSPSTASGCCCRRGTRATTRC